MSNQATWIRENNRLVKVPSSSDSSNSSQDSNAEQNSSATQLSPSSLLSLSNQFATLASPIQPSQINPKIPRITTTRMAAEKFILDPYTADFNPGTPTGNKLFLAATAPLPEDKKLTALVSTQHEVLHAV